MTRRSDKCQRALDSENRQGQIWRRAAAPRWVRRRSKGPPHPRPQPACPSAALAAAPLKSESGRGLGSGQKAVGDRRPTPRGRSTETGACRNGIWPPCAPVLPRSQAADLRSPERPLSAPAPGTQNPFPLGRFRSSHP